jgi:hypothetical protein
MNILKKLFGFANKSEEIQSQPVKEKVEELDEVFLRGTGTYDLEVTGESFYQDNFELLCGERTERGEMKEVIASLVLEDDNKFDRGNAVRVEIEGKQVGYLNKKVARVYRSTMKEHGKLNSIVTCNALIKGGWKRKNGNIGNYGVWLDIPFEEE